jgi:hypothetical protein
MGQAELEQQIQDLKAERDKVVKIQRMAEQALLSSVLFDAQAMNELLSMILESSMLPLAKKTRERVFGDILKNFAAKIDIAYVFELIPETLHRDLLTFKKIRNDYAHPTTGDIDFSNVDLIQQIRTFSSYNAGELPMKVFYEAGTRITAELSSVFDKTFEQFGEKYGPKKRS